MLESRVWAWAVLSCAPERFSVCTPSLMRALSWSVLRLRASAALNTTGTGVVSVREDAARDCACAKVS